MRRIKPALLGSLLLCAVTAAGAAAPPATPAAAPATPAALEPLSPDLFTPAPQTAALIPLCPPQPVVSCNSCFFFGQTLTYQCTLFCVNGTPRRTCGTCGTGCEP